MTPERMTAEAAPLVISSLPNPEQMNSLVMDLPNWDIEGKLDNDKPVDIREFMTDLLTHIPGVGSFQLWYDKVVVADNVVTKYNSPKGSFTLTRHEDGSHRLKKKSIKTYHRPFIISREEDKVLTPKSIDPLIFAAQHYDLDPSTIVRKGSYTRKKYQIYVIHPLSSRVYKLNFDNIQRLDDEGKPMQGTPFQQLEIKYKGRESASLSLKDSSTDVVQDIAKLEGMVTDFAKARGVRFKRSTMTKSEWLEKASR